MNRISFQKVSKLRVREAKVLLNAGYYEGAYYLLGYAVECALKACIAKQFTRHDIPNKALVNEVYSHNLERLIVLAELGEELKREKGRNADFSAYWGVVKSWSEQKRYDTQISEREARDFYLACSARRNGVLKWLKNYW